MGLLSLVLLIANCDGQPGEDPLPANSLAALISELNLPIQRDSLIACAASGQNSFLAESSGLPVSVIYLPVSNSGPVWFFETNGLINDKTDYSRYFQRQLEDKPLLNGFLRKFAHAGASEETIGVVATVSNGKLFLSNEINIKVANQPTVFSAEAIAIDQAQPLMPAFSWSASEQGADAIYFQVVSDVTGNLISGTYTQEPDFQFYKLDNVVLNINDTDPAPSLESGVSYTISVMAVSLDNWVNSFSSTAFRAE